MYNAFYGFEERPFSLTPDTQFFLNQQSHREALNTMLVSLQHCDGFIKIVGEVGTGKTLLCRILLSQLNNNFVTAYIPNPYLTSQELKSFIAKEIGAEYEADMPAHEVLASIYRKLMHLSRSGKQVVLLLDEAQAMPRDSIESLRLLTNLETEKRKLLQVVMVGQPELDVMLSRRDLRQLKQRIVFSEYLKPLNNKGVVDYIEHRVRSAGRTDAALFTSSAMRLLAHGSMGVPRLINILCHKSLLSAYGKGDEKIGVLHVAKAIKDTPECSRFGKFLAWNFAWAKPINSSLSMLFSLALVYECCRMGAFV